MFLFVREHKALLSVRTSLMGANREPTNRYSAGAADVIELNGGGVGRTETPPYVCAENIAIVPIHMNTCLIASEELWSCCRAFLHLRVGANEERDKFEQGLKSDPRPSFCAQPDMKRCSAPPIYVYSHPLRDFGIKATT